MVFRFPVCTADVAFRQEDMLRRCEKACDLGVCWRMVRLCGRWHMTAPGRDHTLSCTADHWPPEREVPTLSSTLHEAGKPGIPACLGSALRST